MPVPTLASDAPATPLAPPAPLDPFLSQKLRFWSLLAMVLLIYVHGYSLHPRQLDPWTVVQEPLTPGTFFQYFISNGLVRFRIPILFAISGYLFARAEGRASHGTRVRKRLRTLGLPYLLWSAIWIGIGWALEQVPLTRWAVVHAEISPFWPRQLLSQLTPGEWVPRWLISPMPFQLWFLRNLLVLNIAYPLLRTAVLRGPKLYFGIVAVIWFFGIDPSALLIMALTGVYFSLAGGEGLLFFALGSWLALTGRNVLTPPRWLRLPVVATLWVGAAAGLTVLAFTLPAPRGPSPGVLTMLALYRLSEVAGILTAWFGLDWLVRRAMARRWFQWLTGFSFMIYVLHVPTINYANELAFRFGRGVPHIVLLTYALLPLLIVAGAVLVGATLRRLVPGLYGVLTGGRGL